MFRCLNMSCEKYQSYFSIRIESFFENFKLSLQVIFAIIYRYYKNECLKKTSEELSVSHPTVIQIQTEIRSLFKTYYEHEPLILGGENCNVQIDESLFVHKIKYHVGRYSDTQVWVFGIADKTFILGKVYLEVVESRSAHRLLPIIQRVVRPGKLYILINGEHIIICNLFNIYIKQ